MRLHPASARSTADIAIAEGDLIYAGILQNLLEQEGLDLQRIKAEMNNTKSHNCTLLYEVRDTALFLLRSAPPATRAASTAHHHNHAHAEALTQSTSHRVW